MFVETINNLPDDVEIHYADESGFEEYIRVHTVTLFVVSVFMEKSQGHIMAEPVL
jgi:hypothetical protein